MVAHSIAEECALAVSAERMWKVISSPKASTLVVKACTGFIDAIEVEGPEGLGRLTTMKFNPAINGGEEVVVKTRLVALDDTAHVIRSEVLQQGAKLNAELKSQVNEFKVEATGESACVVKFKVKYERLDGAPLDSEDQANISKGLSSMFKMVEAYLIAHPDELA